MCANSIGISDLPWYFFWFTPTANG